LPVNPSNAELKMRMISELSLLTMRRVFLSHSVGGFLVPQRRHGDLAGEVRIVLDVELPQRPAVRVAVAVHVLVEQPAFGKQPRPRVGYADHVLEALEHPERERARRPRAHPGNPQMIAPGLGGELGIGIGRDGRAQRAVDAAEAPVVADLLGGGRSGGPLAVVELCHRSLPSHKCIGHSKRKS
jgi:hypothetical protein